MADQRGVLALVHKHFDLALERKATINWETTKIDVQDYLAQQSPETWRRTFVPVLQGLITDQARQWMAQLGIEFSVRNLFAEEWFRDYTMRFAQPISETSSQYLSGVLEQAMREGWSIDRCARNLETVFAQWMGGGLSPDDFAWCEQRMPMFRREMIARTETLRGSNRGTNAMFHEMGVSRKEWLSTKDGRVCDWCAPLDGRVVAVSDNFFNRGDVWEANGKRMTLDFEDLPTPPLHPHCRCTILPVIEYE